MTRAEFNARVGFPMPEDGQYHAVCINLDGLTGDEIRTASEHPGLHDTQRRYCALSINARFFREKGLIERAVLYERLMDEIYEQQMPAALRW